MRKLIYFVGWHTTDRKKQSRAFTNFEEACDYFETLARYGINITRVRLWKAYITNYELLDWSNNEEIPF
jgi:hypothetical protein